MFAAAAASPEVNVCSNRSMCIDASRVYINNMPQPLMEMLDTLCDLANLKLPSEIRPGRHLLDPTDTTRTTESCVEVSVFAENDGLHLSAPGGVFANNIAFVDYLLALSQNLKTDSMDSWDDIVGTSPQNSIGPRIGDPVSIHIHSTGALVANTSQGEPVDIIATINRIYTRLDSMYCPPLSGGPSCNASLSSEPRTCTEAMMMGYNPISGYVFLARNRSVICRSFTRDELPEDIDSDVAFAWVDNLGGFSPESSISVHSSAYDEHGLVASFDTGDLCGLQIGLAELVDTGANCSIAQVLTSEPLSGLDMPYFLGSTPAATLRSKGEYNFVNWMGSNGEYKNLRVEFRLYPGYSTPGAQEQLIFYSGGVFVLAFKPGEYFRMYLCESISDPNFDNNDVYYFTEEEVETQRALDISFEIVSPIDDVSDFFFLLEDISVYVNGVLAFILPNALISRSWAYSPAFYRTPVPDSEPSPDHMFIDCINREPFNSELVEGNIDYGVGLRMHILPF